MITLKWDAMEDSWLIHSSSLLWSVLKLTNVTENTPLERLEKLLDSVSLKNGLVHHTELISYLSDGIRTLTLLKKKSSKMDQSIQDSLFIEILWITRLVFININLETCWEDTLLKLLVGEKKMIKNTGSFKILGPLNGEKMDISESLSENVELTQELYQSNHLFNFDFLFINSKIEKYLQIKFINFVLLGLF